MNDVTERQAALWAKLTNPKEVGIYWADVAQELAPLLPDALTNPQTVLPTEPGWYLATNEQSPSGKLAIELLGTGEWVDNTDSQYLQLSWVADHGPLTRLVPERPEPGPEEIRKAWGVSRESDKSIPREHDGRMLAADAYFAGYKAGAKR